ncbi:MAG: hypothetical protein IJ573_00610 [Clostridia bacterium]|nr:hypothetical protein [Clostridia bacterium]
MAVMIYEQIRERIVEILKDHPLSEIETNMLAEYADCSRMTEAASIQYGTVEDWLECSSRISPRERKELKELRARLRYRQPEAMA